MQTPSPELTPNSFPEKVLAEAQLQLYCNASRIEVLNNAYPPFRPLLIVITLGRAVVLGLTENCENGSVYMYLNTCPFSVPP